MTKTRRNRKVNKATNAVPQRDGIYEVSPSVAEHWLKHHSLTNRRIAKRYVDGFLKDMQNGDWSLTGSGIAFDWNGKLSNGYHRLRAASQTEAGFVTRITVNNDPQSREKEDTGRSRSCQDILRFRGVKHYNLMSGIANCELRYIGRGRRPYEMTPSSAADYAQSIPGIVGHAKTGSLLSTSGCVSGICSAAEPTWLRMRTKRHEDSEAFFQSLAYGESGPLAARKCREYLRRRNNAPRGPGVQERMAVMIAAWNIHAEGRATTRGIGISLGKAAVGAWPTLINEKK